jgi:hypothetical protein
MRQALWLVFQASIVGFWMFAYSEIAEHDGTKFHAGQAFLIGIIWAFLATIAVKFVSGLLRWIIGKPPGIADGGTRDAGKKLLKSTSGSRRP